MPLPLHRLIGFVLVISNDLLINWGGSRATGNRTVTFPQTFKEFRSVLATVATSASNVNVTAQTLDYNSCVLYPTDTSIELLIWWIAIGK
jgi:hypothetical protein